ncbi:MAG TPA: bifunctional phosphoribosylaminoimidazolecarboxamide formyltransferase/IMP cyclohydrolase, partial [Gemmatimonadaceae bacterium]|nr:bifunctional phosphoribosylaminoimidazolecarboxamide formyltransferase/IMP cyclohydrolase [Gemmatimonadaceae bacterium]
TSSYDAAIATWFATQRDVHFPDWIALSLERAQTLRYGENPDQRAAFYVERPNAGLHGLRQRGGKELSFNNLLDLEGALVATDLFAADRPCCAIIKHTTPCGLALGDTALEAYEKALACDPMSAFGSVISVNVPLDEPAAQAIARLFVECLVAPAFSDAAVEVLGRKKNLRVLEGRAQWDKNAFDFKRVRGGFLMQDRTTVGDELASWTVATKRAPTREEQADLEFAWRAVASVKSNAIVIARGGATIGIGAGQMSRVDASFLAVHKARSAGHDTHGAVLGSDAYFPFRDGIDQAVEAGITAIVQPGGSVRDDEVIAAADERGIAMVLTGKRLFRH